MLNDGITLVFLSQGKVALIDTANAEQILAHKWTYSAQYAKRNKPERKKNGVKTILMHREIVGALPSDEWDHINRNKLDNRRCNLRRCNRAQNMANAGPRSTNRSGYRGVSWDAKSKKWAAFIEIDGRSKCLGRFQEVLDAAHAWDRAALKEWGEFAFQNIQGDDPLPCCLPG